MIFVNINYAKSFNTALNIAIGDSKAVSGRVRSSNIFVPTVNGHRITD